MPKRSRKRNTASLSSMKKENDYEPQRSYVTRYVEKSDYAICEVNGYSTVSDLIDKEKLKRFIDE